MKELLAGSLFWGGFLTLGCYQLSVWLRGRLRNHPLANPMLITILLLMAFLTVCGIDYESYSSSTAPLQYLVTPATVCFAIPLYRQLQQLRRHGAALLCGIAAGVAANLVMVFLTYRVFALTAQQHATLLPKSVTAAIATGISAELGGAAVITVASVMVTGVFGSIVAPLLLRLCRLTNPMAQGVALGSSAHVIGTARAMEMGEIQGAMSSLAVVVAGLMTVAAAPIYMRLVG